MCRWYNFRAVEQICLKMNVRQYRLWCSGYAKRQNTVLLHHLSNKWEPSNTRVKMENAVSTLLQILFATNEPHCELPELTMDAKAQIYLEVPDTRGETCQPLSVQSSNGKKVLVSTTTRFVNNVFWYVQTFAKNHEKWGLIQVLW